MPDVEPAAREKTFPSPAPCSGLTRRELPLVSVAWWAAAALRSSPATATPKLLWSDEFEGPRGAPPDPGKWRHDLGANGWGNAELEQYTAARENASLDGQGNLVIRALAPRPGVFTSARLKTEGLFEFQYGRVEARIRLPHGQGIWPAFWMLGARLSTAGWPQCGEIDIVENVGFEPALVHGTVHGPGYSGAHGIGKAYSLPPGRRFTEDFHTFAVNWSKDSVEFQVDGRSYHYVTPASLPKGARWVYNQPFFLLLNLAVGGRWPGNPDSSTAFPQAMVVDYVRVWH